MNRFIFIRIIIIETQVVENKGWKSEERIAKCLPVTNLLSIFSTIINDRL